MGSPNTIGRDLPFSAQICKFIDKYIDLQDLDKAAVEAGFEPEMGRMLWRRLPVREEIESRLAAVKSEVHKLIAKKKVVNIESLDKNLMQLVRIPMKDLKESPALAATKKGAIELGYQRTGILIDGNFIPDAGSDANKPDEAPRIFRTTEQSIITHQIEARQTVTTRAVEASQPPTRPRPSEPPTIDAEDPWAAF